MDRNTQKLVGTVVSDAMDKSVVVRVDRLVKHILVKKYLKRSKKYYAHDENNTFKKGDVVELLATRPLSKLKRWRTSKLIKNGNK